MWNFKKIELTEVAAEYKYIAFTGSGGKTSLAEHMAGRFLGLGRTVAITTTTKIFAKEPYSLIGTCFDIEKTGPFMRFGKSIEKGKLTAVSYGDIEIIGSIYDVVLIEADGARGMPLKFPADHEPVIPPFCEKIFVLSGLDGLYKRVDQVVFRCRSFCEATGMNNDKIITPEVFLRFFTDDILLKCVDIKKCTIVLNKYDAMDSRKDAIKTGKDIITGTGVKNLILSSIFFKVFYGIEGPDP